MTSNIFRSAFSSFAFAIALLLAFPYTVAAQAPTNYKLAWSDDFSGIPTTSGVTVDTNKWWWRMGYTSPGSSRASNVSLDGVGGLDIANASEVVGGVRKYSGGGVASQRQFRYGYYEVTAKTPANTSEYHTAFWLTSLGAPLASWNPAPPLTSYTEVDGFEINSTTPSSISNGVIAWTPSGPSSPNRCKSAFNPGFNTSTSTHTYGMAWTEIGVGFLIDGAQYCYYTYSPTDGVAAPVSIWLTSIPYGATGVPSTGAQAVFSSVAYYVRDYYINAKDTGYSEYGPNWTDSSSPGFSSQPVRNNCTAGESAVYTPNILADGNYKVYYYQVIASPIDTATTLSVYTSTGPVASAVTLPTTGASGWVDLSPGSSFNLAAGNKASLTVTNGNNCLRTSMVKFVRQ